MFSKNLSKIIFALIAVAAFSCSSAGKKTGQGAAAGAVVGGLIGATQGGVRGAAIGAAVGGAAGGGIGYYLDQRQKELARVVETKKTDDGLMVTLKSDVLFDTNKTELQESAKNNLNELAAILKKYPGDKLRITGFTDKVGTTEHNLTLSKQRAEVVKSQLSAAGVTGDRMRAIGMGESRAGGTEKEPRPQDRKVEIYIDVEPPKNS